MDWSVNIRGDQNDLKRLSGVLSVPELAIVQEGEGFRLKSSDWTSYSSAGAVRKSAEEKLAVINGLARLAIGALTPISIVSVEQLKQDGSREVQLHVQETVHLRSSLIVVKTSADGTVTRYEDTDPIPVWLTAASDPTVARVLKLYGSGDLDWGWPLQNV